MKKSKDGRKIPVEFMSSTPADAFYLAEEFFEHGGKAIGLNKNENQLLNTTKSLAHEFHQTHSPMHHTERLEHELSYRGKAFLDVKQKILKRRLSHFH